MSKYRKKPVVVEAARWFKPGDHPKVEPYQARWARLEYISCDHCEKMLDCHGWIETLEGGHIVCPADWIITGIKGEHYPCKPDIFAMTYERAEGERGG